MKPTTAELNESLIKNHLEPFFGSRDLREITEAELLRYIQAKLDGGLKPKTIRNGLSVLRRVCGLLEREGLLAPNPASRIGELLRRVDRAMASETEEVQYWRRVETERRIALARDHEARFAPLLELLFSTGVRRGEALGLQWADVDFDGRSVSIRRAVTAAGLTTPKSGKARRVAIPDSSGRGPLRSRG